MNDPVFNNPTDPRIVARTTAFLEAIGERGVFNDPDDVQYEAARLAKYPCVVIGNVDLNDGSVLVHVSTQPELEEDFKLRLTAFINGESDKLPDFVGVPIQDRAVAVALQAALARHRRPLRLVSSR